MTTPISGTSSTATTGTAAPRKTGESGLGQDAFMKLLVAQLKYQNPMAPADGQAYMTQMATFTQVEKLGQLVTAQADAAVWQQRLSAEGMVGRSVTGSVEGVERTGTVTGVRFTDAGPLLELADGTTLAVDAVTANRAVTAAPASPTASPAGTTTGTTTTGTSTTGTSTGSTTGTTS